MLDVLLFFITVAVACLFVFGFVLVVSLAVNFPYEDIVSWILTRISWFKLFIFDNSSYYLTRRLAKVSASIRFKEWVEKEEDLKPNLYCMPKVFNIPNSSDLESLYKHLYKKEINKYLNKHRSLALLSSLDNLSEDL